MRPLAPPRTHAGLRSCSQMRRVLSPSGNGKTQIRQFPSCLLPITVRYATAGGNKKTFQMHRAIRSVSAIIGRSDDADVRAIDLRVLRPHLSLSSGTCSRLCATGGRPRAACGACSRMAYDAQYDAHSYWRLPGERSRRIGHMSGERSRRIGRMPGERSRGLRTHLTHHQSRRAHLVRRRREGASDGART
jgi:hypothetical protein